MGNIHHDIPGTHHCNAFAEQIFLLTKRRQVVVVENDILGMINARQVLAGQAQPLGALGTGSDQNSLKTGFEQVLQHNISAATDGHVPIIIYPGQVQDRFELRAQALFHFQLIRVYAILCQAAGFDVAVEQHHTCPAFNQFSGCEQARRSGPDNCYHVLRVFHPDPPLRFMRLEL